MRFFYSCLICLLASPVWAFEPNSQQYQSFSIAVERFQSQMELGQTEAIYDQADVSFQAAVQKFEFLATWTNYRNDFGAARRWNISETFWYDQGAQGVFAVSEMQFLTDLDYVGCGYLVFRDNRDLGFRFIRADILFVPTELRTEADRNLFKHIQKAPGCSDALSIFE